VRTKKVAENAIGLLAEGRPFSEVAHALSMDPGSRDNGGDLGWVLTSSLPPPLRTAVAASGPGIIKKAVGGGNTWYVLNVMGERPARVIPLDEIRSDLTDELTRAERAQALERWLDAARERATVVLP
jgi:parvulin-like peptidyl-prolyl isomerase